MLRLTLYKRCKITNSYNTVFAYQRNALIGNSTLEKYLALLTSKVFDIDDVYQEDKGEFIFELETNDYNSIYEFNYMKIETLEDSIVNNKFIRFAFIDSIVIKNEIAVVSYSLDYYHSFVRSIYGCNPSLLSGLRVINNNYLNTDYKLLPVDYASNNELKLYPIDNNHQFHNETDKLLLVVEFQVYETEKYGDSVNSYVKYGIIQDSALLNSSFVVDETTLIYPRFTNINEFINDIVRLQAGKVFIDMPLNDVSHSSQELTNKQRYFKIGHIYVLPDNEDIKDYFINSCAIITDANISIGNLEAYRIHFLSSNYNTVYEKYKEYDINDNIPYKKYKSRGLGFYSKIIPIQYNGTSIPVSLYFFANDFSFRTFLSVENKIIETTDCFEIQVPLTQLNGEVLAQQRISLQLQNRQLDLKENMLRNATEHSIEQNAWSMVGQVNSLIGQIGMIASGMSNGSNSLFTFSSDIASKISNIMYSAENNRLNKKLISAKREAINQPVYNSTTFVSANNIALLNSLVDLCEFYLEADNELYVKECINNMGYNVYVILFLI